MSGRREDEVSAAIAKAREDLERQVIGGVLLDGAELDAALMAGVNLAMFRHPIRAAAWSAIVELSESGAALDAAVVKAEILKSIPRGTTAELVHDEIVKCIDSTPGGVHTADYARALVEIFKRERSAEILKDAQNAIAIGAGYDVASRVAEQLEALSEIGRNTLGLVDLAAVYRTELDRGANPNRSRVVRTGFGGIDRIVGGLEGGQLLVLAGRPSVGKSNIGFAIAQRFAEGENGGVSAFVSLEMSAEQFARKMISQAAGVDSRRIKAGRLLDHDVRRAMENAPFDVLNRLKLYVPPETAIYGLRAIMRDAKKRGAGLVVVDYAGLMVDYQSAEAERIQLSKITKTTKGLARELDIPVVLLAQASRAVDEKSTFELGDLKGSSSFEADADIVAVVEFADGADRGMPIQLIRWTVKKARDGSCGSCVYLVRNNVGQVVEPPEVGSTAPAAWIAEMERAAAAANIPIAAKEDRAKRAAPSRGSSRRDAYGTEGAA